MIFQMVKVWFMTSTYTVSQEWKKVHCVMCPNCSLRLRDFKKVFNFSNWGFFYFFILSHQGRLGVIVKENARKWCTFIYHIHNRSPTSSHHEERNNKASTSPFAFMVELLVAMKTGNKSLIIKCLLFIICIVHICIDM